MTTWLGLFTGYKRSNRPRNGWSFWGGFRRSRLPPACGATLRRDQLRQLQAVPAAPCPPRQPKPVQRPVFALVPHDSLAPYLASPCRPLRRVVRPRTSPSRRWHNSARHFPTNSTRMRRRGAPPPCLRRAVRPASWTPRRALMRETETPKAAIRWLAERGDSPSAHASATHPRILRVCPPRSTPSGQCLKVLSQSERRYWTTMTFSILGRVDTTNLTQRREGAKAANLPLLTRHSPKSHLRPRPPFAKMQ